MIEPANKYMEIGK